MNKNAEGKIGLPFFVHFVYIKLLNRMKSHLIKIPRGHQVPAIVYPNYITFFICLEQAKFYK